MLFSNFRKFYLRNPTMFTLMLFALFALFLEIGLVLSIYAGVSHKEILTISIPNVGIYSLDAFRIIIYLLTGALILFIPFYYWNIWNRSPQSVSRGLDVFSESIAKGALDRGTAKRNSDESSRAEFARELTELKAILAHLRKIQGDKNQIISVDLDKPEFRQYLTEAISSSVGSSIAKELTHEISNKLSKQNRKDERVGYENFVCERLRLLISGLEKRSTVNLRYGIAIGVIGLVVFFLAFIFPGLGMHNADSWSDALVQNSTKASFLIAMEVLAFFFLRQYQKTLVEQRLAHNELTNVELKLIGMYLALGESKLGPLEKTIDYFVQTERNFILDKGQSTVAIEKSKLDVNETGCVNAAIAGMSQRPFSAPWDHESPTLEPVIGVPPPGENRKSHSTRRNGPKPSR